MTNGRRLLRPHIDAYRAALAEAKADLSVMNFRHECRIADLLRQLDEVRAAFEELRAAVLARQNAEHELAALHREREIARAQAAERDPCQPLN